jgi:hypothetical protein
MGDGKAILLIPAKGDPLDLLAEEGPCGALPPRAWCHRTPARVHEACQDCDDLRDLHQGEDGDWCFHCTECHERWPCLEAGKEVEPPSETWEPGGRFPDALVLAWDGKTLGYGCLWLAERAGHVVPGLIRGKVDFLLSGIGDMPGFLGEYGTVVLLDVEGKEVSRG